MTDLHYVGRSTPIFFSKQNVFPVWLLQLLCLRGLYLAFGRTRRHKAVVSLFSSTNRAIFLSPRYFTRCRPHALPPRRTDAMFPYEVPASLRPHRPTPGTYSPQWLTRQGPQTHLNMNMSRGVSHATAVLASVFSALDGQPCVHKLLITCSSCNRLEYCSRYIHHFVYIQHTYSNVDGAFQPTVKLFHIEIHQPGTTKISTQASLRCQRENPPTIYCFPVQYNNSGAQCRSGAQAMGLHSHQPPQTLPFSRSTALGAEYPRRCCCLAIFCFFS